MLATSLIFKIFCDQIPSRSFFCIKTMQKPIYTHRSGRKIKARMKEFEKKKAELGDNFKSKHELKTPKGTQDFGPEQMAVREKVISIITETFKRHGAVTIDTPVFELRKVLMGKYGEEGSKLVYNLDDQDGELCSMRYDLTVPFARYLAANKIERIKRYQIAKVYRRDQPVMTKGRFREFFQCDFDIAGQGELMMQEAECLKIADEVLSKLELGDFEIRVNHRLLLEAIFEASSIPSNLFKTVSSSIDKLDKIVWEEVKEELIKEKGLNEQMADSIGKFLCIKEEHPEWGNSSLFDWFCSSNLSSSEQVNKNILKAIEELKLLFNYTQLFGCTDSKIIFSPSLARGLDYYTGIIYEVVMKDFSFDKFSQQSNIQLINNLSKNSEENSTKKNKTSSKNNEEEKIEESSGNIGSVAAGGRYDKLVGMFLNIGEKSGKKLRDVPCVGISFGIERLFAIMEMKMKAEKSCIVRTSPTQVYVASIKSVGNSDEKIKLNMLHERMKICGKLWAAGIRAETSYKANPKLLEQFQFCENESTKIPWLLIVAEDELAQNCVKLRCVDTREETGRMSKEQQQNQLFIYMPCIFWHDRKGILSIDILQKTKNKKEETIPNYKIVTASIQKEIRVWNFRFNSIKESEENEKIKENIENKIDKKEKQEEKQGEDSIVFLEQKVDRKDNSDNFIENKKDEQPEMEEKLKVTKIQDSNNSFSLSIEFLANLEGHRSTTNTVRFSPNGNFIASGDADGYIIVWILNQPSPDEIDLLNEKQLKELQLNNFEDKNNNEIPPNRENWQRNTKARFSPHPGEITALCFSPDSQFIASLIEQRMRKEIVHNFKRIRENLFKRLWERGAFRHFANGITWDPRGKYLLTLSTDRRLDVLDAFKGTILRSCCQIELPKILLPEINQQVYKIFHDDQLHAFQRGIEFSPCGSVIFAPAAQLEVGTNNIYGTLIFFRNDLKFCRPNALFPSSKPTIQVKCSPLIYKLDEEIKTNFLGLPHRLIFAVLCWDSILLYNSQNETPFAYLANLHYDGLTSIAWTPDGRFLIVSSLEGFISFICMDTKKMGIPIEEKEEVNEDENTQQNELQLNSDVVPNSTTTTTNTPKQQIIELSLPDSPKLITPKRPRIKRTLNNNNTQQTINSAESTPKRLKPEENCTSFGESPKVAEKKKPRKVTVTSVD
ncbi:hypothetical protein Mgra_00005724 [Meloidogyne graminicola]|uniref:histidine--tRNA ligase n=1 Tax=Meloidogyne graminicola TaxID=189291 RepID=A0A8S9ZNF8_9BILA|nr:hypothetical protein Mgra_00005724 [Meloidogyne graminicola]